MKKFAMLCTACLVLATSLASADDTQQPLVSPQPPAAPETTVDNDDTDAAIIAQLELLEMLELLESLDTLEAQPEATP